MILPSQLDAAPILAHPRTALDPETTCDAILYTYDGYSYTLSQMLEPLLPRNRIKVLGLLLGDPSNHYYLREIARACGIPLRAVQRELALYVAMRLVRRVPRGQQVFFAVETDHPIYPELRALIEKASARAAAGPPAHPPLTLAPAGPPAAAEPVSIPPPPRDRSWRVW